MGGPEETDHPHEVAEAGAGMWFANRSRPLGAARTRSSARAVHVRVCAIARRNNSDGDTPAAAALSLQAACSAGVTRAATITVRCSVMSAPETGFGGGAPARPLLRQRRDKAGGSKGGAAPLASLPCSTRSRLAYRP